MSVDSDVLLDGDSSELTLVTEKASQIQTFEKESEENRNNRHSK